MLAIAITSLSISQAKIGNRGMGVQEGVSGMGNKAMYVQEGISGRGRRTRDIQEGGGGMGRRWTRRDG